MRGFTLLCLAVAAAFALTLALDVSQRKLEHKGKTAIIFASMWAPGEPMMKGYEEIFRAFESEYPQYKVEARWDGRWVLPAIRPRFLTGSDIPDILNTDRDALMIIVREGYAAPLDEILDTEPYPHDHDEKPSPGKPLREAFLPRILERCRYEAESDAKGNVLPNQKYAPGTYILPAGVWTGFIFYNRVHYEKLGLESPRTWSQFVKNCEVLQKNGIAPLAADKHSYAQFWSDFLLNRAVGEQTLQATVEGRGPRFNEDPRYRRVFEAIREIHQPGFFLKGWKASQWPAAQRLWSKGLATHMICGSYLMRETLEYDPDPHVFRLGAFPIPMIDKIDWKGQPSLPLGDPTGVTATIVGHALLKKGRNRKGAIQLLAFLARKESAAMLGRVGKEIPPIAGAPFPPELEDIREDFQGAQTVYKSGFHVYAPKWQKFHWRDQYRQFFMHEDPDDRKFVTVDEFLDNLQRRTDEYHAKGGEAGIK